MKLHEWTTEATVELAGVGIGTAKLDAELILSHTLKKSRTWLHAYRDEELSLRHKEIANSRLALRLDRVPLAYIIGHKEFYRRRFSVTPAVLIPRPESEAMIELLLKRVTSKNTSSLRLVDVGTGSGCLGITAKLEQPSLDVTLVDVSSAALKVAAGNADALSAEVRALKSNLLSGYPFRPDIVLANLPYVDPDWERSPETNHEPPKALFANDNGLALIYMLIEQCQQRLKTGGIVLLEADPRQHKAITDFTTRHDFTQHRTRDFILSFEKI